LENVVVFPNICADVPSENVVVFPKRWAEVPSENVVVFPKVWALISVRERCGVSERVGGEAVAASGVAETRHTNRLADSRRQLLANAAIAASRVAAYVR